MPLEPAAGNLLQLFSVKQHAWKKSTQLSISFPFLPDRPFGWSLHQILLFSMGSIKFFLILCPLLRHNLFVQNDWLHNVLCQYFCLLGYQDPTSVTLPLPKDTYLVLQETVGPFHNACPWEFPGIPVKWDIPQCSLSRSWDEARAIVCLDVLQHTKDHDGSGPVSLSCRGLKC